MATSTNRFVGSVAARVAAPAFGAMTVALALAAPQSPRYVTYTAIVAGVVTWLCLVHAIRPLFKRWMQLTEMLHNVAVTVLFSVCYLLLVPLFHLALRYRDPLHLRRQANESSWVPRPGVVDAASLERMG